MEKSILLSRKGETHTTNEGYVITIIEYISNKKCSIIFDDGTILHNKYYRDIKEGSISNPNHKSLYGIGYIGVGTAVPSTGGKLSLSYKTWQGIIRRCYSENPSHRQSSYVGCTICDEWNNFQAFDEWFNKNHKSGQEIDKDILIKNNKIYSPDACRFVPPNINILFSNGRSIRGKYPIGVSKQGIKFISKISIDGKRVCLGSFNTSKEAFIAYKEAKEANIKNMANIHRDQIPHEIYDSMMSYDVDIND